MLSNIAVLYLLRENNAPHLFSRFLRSISCNAAGIPFHFYVIQKGFPEDYIHSDIEVWNRASNSRITVLPIPDEIGFDIHAYFACAAKIEEPLCLFFNSYCRILHPNWLIHYSNAFEQLGSGALVGATGNWATTRNNRTYPNPHIRSNAFLIERNLFLQFKPPEREKQACIEFEAGENSMTRRILARGGKVGIVDCLGRVFLPEEFLASRTLRSYNQESLLVSDNVTTGYQIAGIRLRKRHARNWWRTDEFVSSQPLSERYQVARDWEGADGSVPWQFLRSLIRYPFRYLY